MNTTDTRQAATRFMDRTTPPHLGTLVLMAGVGALNMNVVLPSLPALAEYYKADYAVVQLTVSAYLATTALLQLIVGPLSDRYGRRPVLLVAIVVFLLATLGTVFAPTIESFLALRMLQAAIVGGFALSRAIVRDMVPMDRAASMIGYVTMGMTLAPMLGPIIGGFLQEAYDWQANFLFTFSLGVILLFVVYFDLQETNHQKSESIAAQFRSYPDLFTSRRFWGYTFSLLFASGVFFCLLGGVPFVSVNHLGLSPSQLGLYFVFISFGYMFGNFLSGRYAMRLGVFPMMLGGTSFTITGVALATFFTLSGWLTPMTFFGPLFFVGMGNGMTMPSANAGVVSVRPHLAGSAAGLSGAIMVGGGATLSVFAGVLLTVESGPLPLLLLMLVTAVLGMCANLYTLFVDRQMRGSEDIVRRHERHSAGK